MNILIVSATKEEILPLMNRYQGQDNDSLEIDFLITGLGMMATTFHLTHALNKETYHLCIQAGIAGSFDKNIPIGEVVNVVSEEVADLGSEQADGRIQSVFDLGFLDRDGFPYSDGQLKNEGTEAFDFLPKVRGLSTNVAHGSRSSIEQVQSQFPHVQVESMEGAAFFYVCLHYQIPFLEIRSISNLVEPRDKANWDIPLAIDQLNKRLIDLLEVLT